MRALRRESRGVRSLQKFLIKRKPAPFTFANGAGFLFFVFLRFVVRLDVVRVPEECPETGLTSKRAIPMRSVLVAGRKLAVAVKPAFSAV